jgi:hypothetical protein
MKRTPADEHIAGESNAHSGASRNNSKHTVSFCTVPILVYNSINYVAIDERRARDLNI